MITYSLAQLFIHINLKIFKYKILLKGRSIITYIFPQRYIISNIMQALIYVTRAQAPVFWMPRLLHPLTMSSLTFFLPVLFLVPLSTLGKPAFYRIHADSSRRSHAQDI